jgi:anti-anti-sigma factor
MTAYASREASARARERRAEAPQGARAGLSIVIGRFLGTVVVTLRGTLDTLAATRLAATLQDLIEGQGNLAIALDLRGLRQVAPSGLRVLSAAASGLERRGGCLSLSEPPEAVRRCLDEAGLTSLVRRPHTNEADLTPGARGEEGAIGRAARASARAHHPAGGARRSDTYGSER